MSSSAKPGGFLSNLPNPVARRQETAPIVVSSEAEQAFGLARAPAGAHPEPERSKTFFLPYSACERLELQKISERREMKHIVRQALEEYFERNPLRPAVSELYK